MQKYDVNLVRSEIEMHKKNCSMQARLEAQQRREGNDMSPNALMQLAYIKDKNLMVESLNVVFIMLIENRFILNLWKIVFRMHL